MRQSNLLEVVERQSTIISIQSGVINELFQLLSQHLAIEEMGVLPIAARIGEINSMIAEIER